MWTPPEQYLRPWVECRQTWFPPVQANREAFNDLIQLLGASPRLAFEDIDLDLDDCENWPHPAVALILVLHEGPSVKVYFAPAPEYTGSGAGVPVVWFKQTINKPRGLYAVLHALSNGEAAKHIEPESLLSNILRRAIELPPDGRARVLEESVGLEKAHAAVSLQGYTEVSWGPDAEDLRYYICFVQSKKNGHVYELDADPGGPVDTGIVPPNGKDLLCNDVLRLIRDHVTGKDDLYHNEDDIVNFSLLALVELDEEGDYSYFNDMRPAGGDGSENL